MAEWTALEKQAKPFNNFEFKNFFQNLKRTCNAEDLPVILAAHMNNFLFATANTSTCFWIFRDDTQSVTWTPLKKSNMQDLFMNYIVEEKVGKRTVTKTAFDIWATNPNRRFVDRVFFNPQSPPGFVTNGRQKVCFNLWEGISQAPVLDEERGEEQLATILFHLKEVLCRRDEVIYEYVLQWLANKVQKPWVKTSVALVTSGAQGSGKSVFWEKLAKGIFGAHGMALPDARMITDRFAGSHFADKVFIVVNESKFDTVKEANQIKNLISSDTFKSEQKFREINVEKVYFNFVLTSNDPLKAFPAEPGSNRRYFPVEADPSRANRVEYFDELVKALDEDGMPAFRDFLLEKEITLNLNLPPHTEEKSNAVTFRFDPFESFWQSCIKNHQHVSSLGNVCDPDHRWWVTKGCDTDSLWELFKHKNPKVDCTEIRFLNEIKGMLPPVDGLDLGTALQRDEKVFDMPDWKSANDHFKIIKGLTNHDNLMITNKKRKLEWDPNEDKRKKGDIRAHFLRK